LVFGKESSGLSSDILTRFADRLIAIPTLGEVRSLNLANAAALGIYEALRQLGALDDVALLHRDVKP
jgi:tRNA (cytidine/uridine-2'-O-)-methyltransferase